MSEFKLYVLERAVLKRQMADLHLDYEIKTKEQFKDAVLHRFGLFPPLIRKKGTNFLIVEDRGPDVCPNMQSIISVLTWNGKSIDVVDIPQLDGK